MGSIELVPITQRAAREWVNRTHRHLKYPRGDVFRVALAVNGDIVAVASAGRPSARMLQDGKTLEITRVSSTAEITINACSRLYAALIKAGTALGYKRFFTYTLPDEPGTSLRASNFQDLGVSEGGEWSRPSRTREKAACPEPKRRWLYEKA